MVAKVKGALGFGLSPLFYRGRGNLGNNGS
jgi:hypothetical protein